MKYTPNKFVKYYLNVFMISCGVLSFSPVLYAMYEVPNRVSPARNQCAKICARQFNTIVSLGGASWLVLAVLCSVILGVTYRRAVSFPRGNKSIRGRFIKLVISEACVFMLLCVANLALQSQLLAANDSQETSCLNRYLTSQTSKGNGIEVP